MDNFDDHFEINRYKERLDEIEKNFKNNTYCIGDKKKKRSYKTVKIAVAVFVMAYVTVCFFNNPADPQAMLNAQSSIMY